MANPELLDGDGEIVEEEGCLSIPGPYHETTRFRRIRCRGQDLKGRPLDLVGEGLLARIFQHETDHLEGMLYIDRLDDAGRKAVLAELRRIELGLQEPGKRDRR
jgi:peptide deformylase